MYLNNAALCSKVDVTSGLTLTWDVFKFPKGGIITAIWCRLTLTWDVFKLLSYDRK